ncbi:hypothetical protein [Aliiglaciecola litoralis]|uniref:Bacteriocin-type signal sequence-containing protein n=1 Tax=Aliiglaciecola litoralis TaxID=582857 RepID=A0ABN1LSS5_9ALTE
MKHAKNSDNKLKTLRECDLEKVVGGGDINDFRVETFSTTPIKRKSKKTRTP